MTQLETLLLLRGGPQKATDVARRLRLTESHAEGELMRLVSRRLAAAEGSTYELSRLTEADEDAVRDLDTLYPRYRLAIARAMFAASS